MGLNWLGNMVGIFICQYNVLNESTYKTQSKSILRYCGVTLYIEGSTLPLEVDFFVTKIQLLKGGTAFKGQFDLLQF